MGRWGAAPAAPAPWDLQGVPGSLATARGQHPWTVPVDCTGLPRQAQKTISHSWTIQKQILRLKRTLAIVKVRPKEEEKNIYSLDTKLVLWQHSKTLFNLLKWYKWSNSSEVTTLPGTEPKHYLLETLGRQDWKQCVPMVSALPHLHTQLQAGAPETPRWTTVPGHPSTKIPKASSSIAKQQSSCSSEGFPRDWGTKSAQICAKNKWAAARDLKPDRKGESQLHPASSSSKGHWAVLPALGDSCEMLQLHVKCFNKPEVHKSTHSMSRTVKMKGKSWKIKAASFQARICAARLGNLFPFKFFVTTNSSWQWCSQTDAPFLAKTQFSLALELKIKAPHLLWAADLRNTLFSHPPNNNSH